jgi:hypothetical protein
MGSHIMVSFRKWNQIYSDLQVQNYSFIRNVQQVKFSSFIVIIQLIGSVTVRPKVIKWRPMYIQKITPINVMMQSHKILLH